MRIKTIEEKIDKVYDELFSWLCNHDYDDFYELKITYQGSSDGKTVERSWKKREERLQEKQ